MRTSSCIYSLYTKYDFLENTREKYTPKYDESIMPGSITLSSVFADADKLKIKAVDSGVLVTAAWVDAMRHITITGVKPAWTLKRVETEWANGAAVVDRKRDKANEIVSAKIDIRNAI